MTSATFAFPRPFCASRVSVRERLCRLVLGSPSVAYALHDMRLQRDLRKKACCPGRRRSSEVPVFEVDRRGWKGPERLPRLWLSEPRFDGVRGRSEGRVFVEAYPHDPDPQGWHAYGLARKYLSEGLTYAPGAVEEGSTDERAAVYRARRLRRDCFRAAEILYLHGMRAGNEAARTGLATLYRFDMCEGAYWSGLREKRARHRKAIDPLRRAFALFEQAACAGSAEGSFNLGEMLREGTGCEQDLERAHRCFELAYERAVQRDDEELCGKAALGIAQDLAQGAGVVHDFASAREWYAAAATHLQEAFDSGQWHCKRCLVEARLGVSCMDQELSGSY